MLINQSCSISGTSCTTFVGARKSWGHSLSSPVSATCPVGTWKIRSDLRPVFLRLYLVGQHDDVAAESRIVNSAVSALFSTLSSMFEIVSNTLSLSLMIAFNSASSRAPVSAKDLSTDANARRSPLLRNFFRSFLLIFASGMCPLELADSDYVSQNVREIVC